MQIESLFRRLGRVRYPVEVREVTVLQAVRLSPGFMSITFIATTLRNFVSQSFSDHVKLILPGEDGSPVRRDYTPRHFDPARGELTIEFALHERGPASDWARQAAPGQRLTIAGPKGSNIVPLDYDWHLLAGDATSLPAIHRRVEELPPSARGTVLVEMADPADRRALDAGPGMEVLWVDSAAEFLAALQGLQLPAGEGFAWCAGETSTMTQARAILLGAHRMPRAQVRVAGYWKRGAVGFHEKFAD